MEAAMKRNNNALLETIHWNNRQLLEIIDQRLSAPLKTAGTPIPTRQTSIDRPHTNPAPPEQIHKVQQPLHHQQYEDINEFDQDNYSDMSYDRGSTGEDIGRRREQEKIFHKLLNSRAVSVAQTQRNMKARNELDRKEDVELSRRSLNKYIVQIDDIRNEYKVSSLRSSNNDV